MQACVLHATHQPDNRYSINVITQRLMMLMLICFSDRQVQSRDAGTIARCHFILMDGSKRLELGLHLHDWSLQVSHLLRTKITCRVNLSTVGLMPNTHLRRRRDETVLTRLHSCLTTWILIDSDNFFTNDDNIDQNWCNQTQRSLFGQFPNCRPNRELVANVHTADADATKQFRRVGVGGVYWA